MGKGGAFAVLLMVFMAVTSAMSSETVATTALLTYNFYQSYINPKATGKQLLRFSNFVVPGFAVVASSIAVWMNHAGFSVSFLITISGILVDSAIVPMACTIMWYATFPGIYFLIRTNLGVLRFLWSSENLKYSQTPKSFLIR